MKKILLSILLISLSIYGLCDEPISCSDYQSNMLSNGDTTCVVLCAEDYNAYHVGGMPTTRFVDLGESSTYYITGHIEMTSIDFGDFIYIREVNADTSTIRYIGSAFNGTQDVLLYTQDTRYIAIDIYCYDGAIASTSGFILYIKPAEKTPFDNIVVAGNLGIGTTNPTASLDVVGDVKIRNNNNYLTLAPSVQSISFQTSASRFNFDKSIRVNTGVLSTSQYTNMTLQTFNTPRITILQNNGFVGIGTITPQYKLDVTGGIHSDSIKTGAIVVESVSGADFVFDNNYDLPSLDDVNAYIQAHGHLPSIPSSEQMQQDGVDMSKFQIQLLQKIEELTLYIIKQDERIKELENKLQK